MAPRTPPHHRNPEGEGDGEATLGFSQATLAKLVEFSPDAIVTTDGQGRIEWVNAQTEKLFGYHRSELVGQPVELLVPERSRQMHLAHRRAYHGAPRTRPMGAGIGLYGRRKNGTEFPADIMLSPIDTGREQPIILAIVRDITERKWAEEALQLLVEVTAAASAAASIPALTSGCLETICKFRQWPLGQVWFPAGPENVLVCSAESFWADFDVTDFRAVSLATTFEKGRGLPGRVWESGTAAWVMDVRHDPNFPRFRAARAIGLKAGFAFPVVLGGEVLAVFEFLSREFREPDQPFLDAVEKLGRLLGDVLKRKRAEEQVGDLLRFEQLLSDLSAKYVGLPAGEAAQEIPHGLQRIARFLDVERAAISEFSPDSGTFRIIDWWGRPGVPPPSPLLSREDFPWVSQRLLRGEIVSFARPENLPDEARRDREAYRRLGIVSHVLVPLGAGGSPVGAVAFTLFNAERSWAPALVQRLRLVGELFASALARKRAEEALEEARADLARVARVTMMGELTAAIAHEVNQPLAAIVNNANACSRVLGGTAPDLVEVREAVTDIAEAGTRASEVIARIRALLKKAVPEKSRLDVNEAIREVLALSNTGILRHGVGLRTDLAAQVPLVRGDRVQLQQVILNLLLNGIEALSSVTDRPRDLLVASRTDEAGHVVVAVQDTGVGVDPRHMDRIFTALFTTKPDGMGMGLSISRSIIEAHGGRLWATPNEGPGVTFQFALPVWREGVP
jgi:PAS domain S-box-containing protein